MLWANAKLLCLPILNGQLMQLEQGGGGRRRVAILGRVHNCLNKAMVGSSSDVGWLETWSWGNIRLLKSITLPEACSAQSAPAWQVGRQQIQTSDVAEEACSGRLCPEQMGSPQHPGGLNSCFNIDIWSHLVLLPPRLLGFLLHLSRVALIVGGVCSFRLLTARFHVNSLKLYSCVSCSQKDPVCVLLMIYTETIAKHCNISRRICKLPWRAKRVAIIPILKVGIHFLFFLPLPFHSTVDQILFWKGKVFLIHDNKLAKDKKVSFVQYNQRDGVQTDYKTCTNSLFRPEPISTQVDHANMMIIGHSGTSSR